MFSVKVYKLYDVGGGMSAPDRLSIAPYGGSIKVQQIKHKTLIMVKLCCIISTKKPLSP